MNTKLVVALLGIGMLSGLLLVAPPAAGVATLDVEPAKYHPLYYVPGEQMQFTVNIASGDPRVYDVLITWDDGTPANFRNWSGNDFNDLTVPGTDLSITRSFTLPTNIPDGGCPFGPCPGLRPGFYYVGLHDATWIETNGTSGITYGMYQFSIRTWSLSLYLDKNQYLQGDNVTVRWSANLIRDGSAAPAGSGQLWGWDVGPGPDNHLWGPGTLTSSAPWPLALSTSSGLFKFQLLPSITTDRTLTFVALYNDTVSNPLRYSYAAGNAPINNLRVLVRLGAASYEMGGVVTVDVGARNTDNFPGNWGDPAAPNVKVDISVRDQSTSAIVPQYGAANLLTDAHGNLRYAFQLNATGIADGTQFLVTANGNANSAVLASGSGTFTVTSRAAMSLLLTFDKSQYLSGDTIGVTADVIGNPGPFVYNYETRDGSTGNLFDRTTSTTNTYQYPIPATFDGSLTVSVTANDGNGNWRTSSRTFTIVLGILTVTLDRQEYNGGDTITATYALTRNPGVLASPTYYYEVFDAGVLVKSGIATGAVQYQVPQVPSTSYVFQITASQSGRSIAGSATAVLTSGVILSVGFDRASYLPGETIRIDYTLTARGRTRLPSGLTFIITMPGAPTRTVQATSTSGTQTSGSLYYSVPGGYNEGPVPIGVLAFDPFGSQIAYAQETVIIGPTNSFWTTQFGGIPAFDVILGLLVLFAFILIVLMWYRLKPGMAGVKAPAEKPSAPPPPATAGPGPAPMTVSCKACGAPIEITTSKRPIEVMCPSCGETQMVQ